jgi:hypothetical protein
MPNLFQLAWMLGVALATVLLPATNERLPCSTRPWVIALVLASFGLWVLDRLIWHRGGLQSTRSWWWLALGLSLYGWLMALVPSAMLDEASGTLFRLDAEWWKAFGTIDSKRSTAGMSLVSLTMMLLLMTADIARDRFGRYWMATAVSLAGTLAAVAGLWTQTNADRVNLWQVPHVPASVFGLFWYHGNAASFLNLVWPVTAWLTIGVLRVRLRPVIKHGLVSALGGSLVLQLVAVFVNVSKMGHALALMELVMLAVVLHLVLWRHQFVIEHAWRRWAWLMLMAFAFLALIAWLLGGNQGLSRWQSFSTRGFDDPARRHAAWMALRMGSDSAWTGTGVGTFEVMSPHYAVLDPVTSTGWWRHAHNDYAQFYAEWGWIGCVLLLMSLRMPVMALLNSWHVALRRDAPLSMASHRRSGIACFSVSLFSVLVHAFVDFPFQIVAPQNMAVVVAGMLVALSVSSTKHRDEVLKR